MCPSRRRRWPRGADGAARLGFLDGEAAGAARRDAWGRGRSAARRADRRSVPLARARGGRGPRLDGCPERPDPRRTRRHRGSRPSGREARRAHGGRAARRAPADGRSGLFRAALARGPPDRAVRPRERQGPRARRPERPRSRRAHRARLVVPIARRTARRVWPVAWRHRDVDPARSRRHDRPGVA